MAAASRTIDHEEIRGWVERNGGHPARVSRARGKDEIGMLRLDFGASAEGSLEPLRWDEWLARFDEQRLALLYQDGKSPRFNKLVPRDAERERPSMRRRPSSRATRRGSATRGRSATARQAAKRQTTKRQSLRGAATKALRRKSRASDARNGEGQRAGARRRATPEMTKAELYVMARSAGVPKRSSMSKAELLRALGQRR